MTPKHLFRQRLLRMRIEPRKSKYGGVLVVATAGVILIAAVILVIVGK